MAPKAPPPSLDGLLSCRSNELGSKKLIQLVAFISSYILALLFFFPKESTIDLLVNHLA